jgi:hypothetical protein
MLHTTLDLRCRRWLPHCSSYLRYEPTYDVVCLGKCKSYTMSYEKNSCGRANQTSSPPVMSKSTKGSKSSKGSYRTDMGPPDTQYPVKKGELDVHHINIAYDVVCNIVYDVVYDVVYYVIYDVAVGKKNHACGRDVQVRLSK